MQSRNIRDFRNFVFRVPPAATFSHSKHFCHVKQRKWFAKSFFPAFFPFDTQDRFGISQTVVIRLHLCLHNSGSQAFLERY